MDTITKEISDVVCTAITLGHIKKFEFMKNMKMQKMKKRIKKT